MTVQMSRYNGALWPDGDKSFMTKTGKLLAFVWPIGLHMSNFRPVKARKNNAFHSYHLICEMFEQVSFIPHQKKIVL